LQGKLLEGDVPAWIVTFQTQEVLLFRNAATKEIAVGAEDKVEQCQYVAVVSRFESDLDDEITGGWKVVEVRIHDLLFFFVADVLLRWQGDLPELSSRCFSHAWTNIINSRLIALPLH
jgi:hypothetical protein